jgi:signal transduction histidine kinase
MTGGELRLTNPEAARLLEIENEWKRGDATPLPVERLLGAAGGAADGRLWEYAIGEGAAAKTLAVTATSVAGADGAAGEQILILRDVTDEKRMIEERETARRVQALAEIATLLAHEIRNPLGSLELFAGLIADSTASLPDVKKWVDHLQAGLRGLSATVNNVLQFHSQPSPQLMPTPLDRLLRETVEFLRPLARQKNMQASLINRVGMVDIAADPHRLRQVFFNLALNAFRAMNSGGALYFRLDWPRGEQGRKVLVEVEDNGHGIAAEHLEKIFDAGFTTHGGSPGLGLAVVRTVAEQHRAELTVRSAASRGTTFALRFPVLRPVLREES